MSTGGIRRGATEAGNGERVIFPKNSDKLHHLSVYREICEQDCYRVLSHPTAPSVVVDIGASFGPFSCLALHHWPGCSLFAYEPGERNFEALQLNTGVLDNQKFQLNRSSVIGRSEWAPYPQTPNRVIGGDIRFAESLPIEIDFLKIDCEGPELSIIDELHRLGRLESIRHISGEWHFRDAFDRLPMLLSATHQVEMQGDGKKWGLFFADRRQ